MSLIASSHYLPRLAWLFAGSVCLFLKCKYCKEMNKQTGTGTFLAVNTSGVLENVVKHIGQKVFVPMMRKFEGL